MAEALGWLTAAIGPAVLTAALLRLGGAEKRDYIFLYLALVAVLGVLRGLWPALAAAALSFLLVDFFFVPPAARSRSLTSRTSSTCSPSRPPRAAWASWPPSAAGR
jgi:K+-sensing histidine kinase KdpD